MSWLESLAQYTRAAQSKCVDPAAWAAHVWAVLSSHGVSLPSPELARLLASYLCSSCMDERDEEEEAAAAGPLAWKYVERALAAGLAPPMLLIALLSVRIIPIRLSKPMAYRLYLELVRRYVFCFPSRIKGLELKGLMVLVDDALHLSENFGLQACEPWALVVLFIFSIMFQLLNATFEDEDLQKLNPEEAKCYIWSFDRNVNENVTCIKERTKYNEKLQKENIEMAIEIICLYLDNKLTTTLLSLASENMPSQWRYFTHWLHILATKSSSVQNSTDIRLKLQKVLANLNTFGKDYRHCHHLKYHASTAIRLASCHKSHSDVGSSSIWIPIDMYLEDCIDSSVVATNTIKILSGLLKALRAINGSTWHDAFLALWVASLRLVQRGRDPIEGPSPCHDTRLCMLLSITTLSIADIIAEEEVTSTYEYEVGGTRRKDLASCLHILGDYKSLLVPPVSAAFAANHAAAKALTLVSGLTIGDGSFEKIGTDNRTVTYTGSMWHLIVEACISRNLLDTSAYSWPGYISGCRSQIVHSVPYHLHSWFALMGGAPMTSLIVNALEATPASRGKEDIRNCN